MSNQVLPPIDYYQNEDLWGNYQYVTLNQMVDNFIMNYIGDDKLLSNVKRHNVLFHLKRGVRELHYDAVREVRGLELELNDSLILTLPNDFVGLVRVSFVGKDGLLYVLSRDTRTAIGRAYLQDHEFNILFDEDGFPLEANETEVFKNYTIASETSLRADSCEPHSGATSDYGLNPDLNKNGYYQIDKRRGVLSFSSNIRGRLVFIEYISDGLEFQGGADVKIHKFAEQTLYSYVKYMLLSNKINVQEYIVNRAKKEYLSNLVNTKVRMLDLKGLEMMIKLRGRNKWIK